MRTFTLEKFIEIKGKIPFYKLLVNGKCPISNFENEISKGTTYLSECKSIIAFMDAYSNGTKLPPTKFKTLKVPKSKHSFFEFKSKHIRYYGFKYEDGIMIICTAEKNDKSEQDKDILRVSNIAEECFSKLNVPKKIAT